MTNNYVKLHVIGNPRQLDPEMGYSARHNYVSLILENLK